jgi:hypothetical protein
MLDTIARVIAVDSCFQIVAELVSALDNFPKHKIALTLRSARVREVEAELLMQPQKDA